MKKKLTCRVYEQTNIAPDIYDMWIDTELAAEAHAGQFVSVYPHNKSTLLPRPISICEVDKENSRIRLVYRLAGQGTREFAGYHAGESIDILGPLGNGYDMAKAAGRSCLLLGGGIGIPPMLQLAKEISALPGSSVTVAVGFRDANLFLVEDLEKYATVLIATEDGSVGTKGNVMDAIREAGVVARTAADSPGITPIDAIFSCGPMPMLRAIKGYAEECDIPAYISLEERMACGVGACLGCVCKTTHMDHHSHVDNTRICTDGPVFEAREVAI